MKPRQPAYNRKVLIPEDEKHLSPGESLGDFFEQGEIYEKSTFYIRIGNRRTSR